MDQPIIVAKEVGKVYRLGEAHRTGGHRLMDVATYPLRNLRRLRARLRVGAHGYDAAADPQLFHALQDVSFTVRAGDVLGIIGHNGAGKSTLLKILSRITEPSSGAIDLRGRVSSLLEVGTGFHHELTGRENVYLNGTILGMSRTEVKQKFDEIVAFSGVEEYIDTPVKFYSSGMMVRLAFAVAAHLEPEILIIDEVLAVGDLAFQEKCLGKMDTVSRSGRTVLFVSHNMGAVEGLCHRCLLLDRGRKTYDGNVAEAIRRYRVLSTDASAAVPLDARTDRDGRGRFRFTGITLNGGRGVAVGEALALQLDYQATTALPKLRVAVKFCRNFRETVMTLDSAAQGSPLEVRSGAGILRIDMPRFDLLPGQYFIDLRASSGDTPEDQLFNAAVLTVADRDLHGTGNVLDSREHGLVTPPRGEWQLLR